VDNIDDLRELIREELEAHDKRHIFAPREPSRITDPETGQEWITGALPKAEIVRFVAWALGGLLSVILAGLLLWAKVVVFPEVDARIGMHEKAALERMRAESGEFVRAKDFNTFVAEKNQLWKTQLEINARTERRLDEIQTDIKELLRRR